MPYNCTILTAQRVYLYPNFSNDILRKDIPSRQFVMEGLNIYEENAYEYTNNLKEELALALNLDYRLLNNSEESLLLIDNEIENNHDIEEFSLKYFLNILLYINQCLALNNKALLLVVNNPNNNVFWEPQLKVGEVSYNSIPWLVGNIYDNEYNIYPLLPTYNMMNNFINSKGVI